MANIGGCWEKREDEPLRCDMHQEDFSIGMDRETLHDDILFMIYGKASSFIGKANNIWHWTKQ